MLQRLFAGSAARPGIERVLRHGSLVDGRIRGPLLFADGTRYRSAAMLAELDVNRSLDSLAAARLLADYLLYAERTNAISRKASGRTNWQGHHARRLGLSTRGSSPSSPSGAREVQRYARLWAVGGVLRITQPNAANVPDTMRAEPNARGQWAYNVTTLITPLPLELGDVLRRWQGMPVSAAAVRRAPLPCDVLDAAELAALNPMAMFRAALVAARASPR